MSQPTLILASSSPQRRDLLTAAGYSFEVVVPHESAECGVCSSSGPAELVAMLAMRKGANVVDQLLAEHELEKGGLLVRRTDEAVRITEETSSDWVVIACDTVAECGGEILGKPVDIEHAREMLLRLRGQAHRVYSGLCVWPLSFPRGPAMAPCPSGSPNVPKVRVDRTSLQMEAISHPLLEAYLASGQWRGKAGAFGYQDRSGWLRITQGSESNVIGLPMELLAEMLAAV